MFMDYNATRTLEAILAQRSRWTVDVPVYCTAGENYNYIDPLIGSACKTSVLADDEALFKCIRIYLTQRPIVPITSYAAAI